MTDRDRLEKLYEKATEEYEKTNKAQFRKSFICDYLLANGVIAPPCKVGDIVYTIFEGDIEALKIIYTKTEESTESIRKHYDAENKFLKMPFADCHIGKSIFLTKEEAERELRKESDNNG